MKKRLRWDPDQPKIPKRPYRDTAIVYAGFAVVVVAVAWLTGGPVLKAAVIAGLFFVVATAWSWTHWRTRLREEARRKAKAAREGMEA